MAFQRRAQLCQGSKPEHMWDQGDRNPPGLCCCPQPWYTSGAKVDQDPCQGYSGWNLKVFYKVSSSTQRLLQYLTPSCPASSPALPLAPGSLPLLLHQGSRRSLAVLVSWTTSVPFHNGPTAEGAPPRGPRLHL